MAQVRLITGNKILRILKAKGQPLAAFYREVVVTVCHLLSTGLAPTLPEDLYHLIKKAVAIRKHMEKHRKVQYMQLCLPKLC